MTIPRLTSDGCNFIQGALFLTKPIYSDVKWLGEFENTNAHTRFPFPAKLGHKNHFAVYRERETSIEELQVRFLNIASLILLQLK